MSDNARDTQFVGFSKALITELHALDSQNWRDFIRQAEPIIARRAYDLVLHTVENVDICDLDSLFRQEVAERIPDMTELPKESS